MPSGPDGADQLAQIKRLHSWLLEVEHILDESRTSAGEAVSNATVGSRLDSWREQMTKHLSDGSLSELAEEIDPVLKKLDHLLDDDELYRASCEPILGSGIAGRWCMGGTPRRWKCCCAC